MRKNYAPSIKAEMQKNTIREVSKAESETSHTSGSWQGGTYLSMQKGGPLFPRW